MWMQRIFRISLCKTCGIAYGTPKIGSEAHKWADLCPEHRWGPMDLARRKRELGAWALCNWERLEKEMLAERERLGAEALKRQHEAANVFGAAMSAAAQQNTMHAGYNQSGLSGLGSGLY